ncbi:MAG: TetR/AcrR family transcriptional regulator [Solirubrobacterales bacterium]|nr:TetR/AcrR family transcriptional regulator [Solirubrobacterales bacterium]
MAASSPQTDSGRRERAAHLGPERRRPLILDVALELFVEHGYQGTSMDAIARAAGVTKPVVYSCFPSKSALFGALLNREEQRMLSHFAEALQSGVRLDDLEETLVAGFTSMLRAVEEAPEAYRVVLLGRGDNDAVIDARVRKGREQRVSALAAVAGFWVAGWVPEGRVEAVTQFVGQTLVSMGEAGVRTMLAAPERWSARTLGRTLGRLAAGGFRALMDTEQAAGAHVARPAAQRVAQEL